MLIPVKCRYCDKITAYVEQELSVDSPAVTQAKGTKWEIVATCPLCIDEEAHSEKVQSNPFGDQGFDDLLNIFGMKK